MGYYVHTEGSNFHIKKENFDAAFERACELNKHDELKSGGTIGGDGVRARWFSWVAEDYDKTCTTLAQVFDQFRLEPVYYNGDIVEITFDSKIGDEDLLLAYIAPFVEDGSYIEWRGEEGERWRHIFQNGVMKTSHAVITFPEPEEFSKVDYRIVDGKVVPYVINYNPETQTFRSSMVDR